MKNSKSFSVLFWANKSKATVNGLVPLYARVTVDSKRAEISLKKKLNPKKWDPRSGFMKGSGDEVRITNKYINEVGNNLFEIYVGLSRCDRPVTAEAIKDKIPWPGRFTGTQQNAAGSIR
ncbi:Arm DNA-binding domain-containing protein [Mucilaginibacter sp. PAMB04274]|uniref:Arm DNA-binding domain-containing protein n=1 Tax=Mucilaginibacter sp. PAMB04274 TaxID=3138568 RepID=UPI0031F6AE37